jgi:hypothetical protein
MSNPAEIVEGEITDGEITLDRIAGEPIPDFVFLPLLTEDGQPISSQAGSVLLVPRG